MKKLLLLLVVFTTSCSIYKSYNTMGIGREPDFNELIPTSDYVIYSDCVTLPTLYITLHMQTHNKPSFLYMGRENTIDTTKLPPHVTLIAQGGSFDGEYSEPNMKKMKDKIAELNRANPNATFTLYGNDLRSAASFIYFYSQGISRERVTVAQLSDGTATYTEWAENFSKSSSMSLWAKGEKKYWDTFKKTLTEKDRQHFRYDGEFLTHASTAENTSMWMQWPELLVSDSTDLKNYLDNKGGRYLKIDPLKYFQSLSQEKQSKVIELFGLDKKWTKGELTTTLDNQTIGEAFDESPKPNIIIVGTSTINQQFITDTIKYYGDGYDYFFKGHPNYPSAKPTDSRVTILPNQIPMEAIIWSYGDKMAALGGYESSLFMNAPKSIKKFFYATKITVSPLDIMYRQGLLGEVKFIY